MYSSIKWHCCLSRLVVQRLGDLHPVTVNVPLLLSSAERGRGGKEEKKKKRCLKEGFQFNDSAGTAAATVPYLCWLLQMCGWALSGGFAQPACLVAPALFIICVCVGSVNRSAGRRPASLNPFYISILKSDFRRITSF